MEIEMTPVNLRKIQHKTISNYREYLDNIIRSKIEDWRKRKEVASIKIKKIRLRKTPNI